MEATTIIGLSKAIGLGIKAWKAYCDEGLDEKDLAALNDVVAGVAGAVGGAGEFTAAAAQLGLVAAAFGRAFERHWVGTRSLARPGRLRRWFDKEEKQRDHEIQTRLRLAGTTVSQIGDRAPGQAEFEAMDQLVGNPLGTPYYRNFWRAFTDPAYDTDGAEAPMDGDTASARQFERHFLLAYWEAFESNAGKPVRDYLTSLEHDRVRLMQAVMVADLITWDERHVFGNDPRTSWQDDEILPFLPLSALYVEPEAIMMHAEGGKAPGAAQPIIKLLDTWLNDSDAPTVAVIQADFGMGKSLTARFWTCRLAQRWRDNAHAISLDVWLPIFVDCGRDILSDSPHLPKISQRARKRHTEELGIAVAIDDPGLDKIASDQRTVFVLDGLDEIAFGQRALDGFFNRLRDHATARHRVLVLSRPGVLPERRELARARVFELQQFADSQVRAWLKQWNAVAGQKTTSITTEELDKRKLTDLAATPILLFMIAYSWDEHVGSAKVSQAQIYETFMLQMARGKHEVDKVRHQPVYRAAKALQNKLIADEVLDDSAEPHEAMLWVLARLAWKERCRAWDYRIDQRLRYGHGEGDDGVTEAPALARRDIESLLEDELELNSSEAGTVMIGLLLTLQRDTMANNNRFHFGHKSFREFLVARYWADRLRKLARGRMRGWEKYEEQLTGGRLLLPEDRSFAYLCQILLSESERPSSPLAWTRDDREAVRDWAQEMFNDETQRFDSEKRRGLRDDRGALLREAALAIGSAISVDDDYDVGLKARTPWTLRSLLAWFWYTREPVVIYAQKAVLRNAMISGTFRIADFSRADLRGAKLSNCNLYEADFSHSDLSMADLGRANLGGANLGGANLGGASLAKANLVDANLLTADLRGTDLVGAGLIGANLRRADLVGANLGGANLIGANLEGAILDGANLVGANLKGTKGLSSHILHNVRYSEYTQFPEGLNPSVDEGEDVGSPLTEFAVPSDVDEES